MGIIEQIDSALKSLETYRATDTHQAESICRQLEWCKSAILGNACEHAPGPLTMGIIATREFDMWGNEPELAECINEIQRKAIEVLNLEAS